MSEKEWIILLRKCMYQIRIAIDCCKVYDAIQNAKKDNFNKMKQSEYFFAISINALAYRANMETAKLFDARNDICFQKVWEHFINSSKMFSKYEGNYYCVSSIMNNSVMCGVFELEKFKNAINSEFLQYKCEITNLLAQRDKVMAHNDKKYYPYQASINVDFPFNGECLENILDIFQRFCNVLLYTLNGEGIVSYDNNRYDDVNNLFK